MFKVSVKVRITYDFDLETLNFEPCIPKSPALKTQK
jgi:hypothetical protein